MDIAAGHVSSGTVDDTTRPAAAGFRPAVPEAASARPAPVHSGEPAHAGLPGRRVLTVWFAVFTLYAGGEIFTRHADGTWGAWACGGYAGATLLLLITRSWLLPLGAAVAGAFLAPLTWMILKVPDTSTAEVVVINRSADYLAAHGTPYLPASLITDWQHYNPYLPLMELFGLPRAAGAPGLLGDPRIWTSLLTVAALTAAFALLSPHPVRSCAGCRRRLGVLAAVAVVSPLIAFPLSVGVTDPPIIALTCLALALAARSQFLRAALVIAVACAMKPTAWAVIPVLAVLAWVRASRRTAVRFTGTAVGAAVLLALAAAPSVFATPDAIRQNLIDYPLGTSRYKTVADSPLPGHLISQLGHAGHLTVDALLLLAVLVFAAWLLARPPRDARDAAVRLIVLYAVLFTLAPSTRYGYYAYPLALVGWLALSRPRSETATPERAAGATPGTPWRGTDLAIEISLTGIIRRVKGIPPPLNEEEYRHIYSKVPRLTVEILVRNDGGSLYLARRAIEPCKGQWHLPGGTVRFGEALLAAVHRIAMKELSIDVREAVSQGFIEYPSHYLHGLDSPVGLAFEVIHYDGSLKINCEASDSGWFKKIPPGMHADQDAFLLRKGYLAA